MEKKEGDIKREIVDWLLCQPQCYVRTLQIAGIRGRANSSKGMSDLIGVWQGRALAIEVKKPGGRVSLEQSAFLEAWKQAGGIAFVADCLEDVRRKLEMA